MWKWLAVAGFFPVLWNPAALTRFLAAFSIYFNYSASSTRPFAAFSPVKYDPAHRLPDFLLWVIIRQAVRWSLGNRICICRKMRFFLFWLPDFLFMVKIRREVAFELPKIAFLWIIRQRCVESTGEPVFSRCRRQPRDNNRAMITARETRKTALGSGSGD